MSKFKDIETVKNATAKVEKMYKNVLNVKVEDKYKSLFNLVLECILKQLKDVLNVKEKVK
jgi:hypothetical protein